MGDSGVSLLYQRAIAALEALDAGDGRPPSGGVLDWSLALGSWLLKRREGRPASQSVFAVQDAPPFPAPPTELPLPLQVAGAGAVVGLARRPQDHNGIVDDVVTLVEPLSHASTDIAGAAALAAFLSALLDGWAMEGALAQSLFVAKRAETFGKVKGPSVVDAIRDVFDEIYAGERARPAEAQERADARGAEEAAALKTLKLQEEELIAEALGLAYLCPDALQAIAAAKARGADRRYLAAVAGMLAAAFAPATLPQEERGNLEERPAVLEVVDELLEIRMSRYSRIPQYGDRFRRKKC